MLGVGSTDAFDWFRFVRSAGIRPPCRSPAGGSDATAAGGLVDRTAVVEGVPVCRQFLPTATGATMSPTAHVRGVEVRLSPARPHGGRIVHTHGRTVRPSGHIVRIAGTGTQ